MLFVQRVVELYWKKESRWYILKGKLGTNITEIQLVCRKYEGMSNKEDNTNNGIHTDVD